VPSRIHRYAVCGFTRSCSATSGTVSIPDDGVSLFMLLQSY
jgi:hypothetical protein